MAVYIDIKQGLPASWLIPNIDSLACFTFIFFRFKVLFVDKCRENEIVTSGADRFVET